MARTIAVAGGRGGVGKSTVAALIAVTLSERGKRVTLFDGNLCLPSLDVIFSVQPNFGAIDVIKRGVSPQAALIRPLNGENLYLLPSVASKDANTACYQEVKAVVNELKRFSDFVVVDCPGGVEQPFLRAALSCDECVIVIDKSVQALRGAHKTLELLSSFGIKTLGLIYIESGREEGAGSPDDFARLLDAPLLGIIRERKQRADAAKLADSIQKQR